MKTMKTLSAFLLGLMFLVSTFGVATATIGNSIGIPVIHSIAINANGSQPVPDTIKLTDVNGNVFQAAQANGVAQTTFWFSRDAGTTLTLNAVVEKTGYVTFSQQFTVNDQSPGDLPAISYALQQGSGGGQQSGDIYVKDLDFKDEVAPGAEVSFDLELKNNATYDAEDVEATLVIKDLDDGDDVESTIDFGDIDLGDDQEETVAITIPTSADDEKYDVQVELKWYDAAGKQYTSTYTSPDQLEVVKQKHQVLITDLQTDAGSYEAGDVVQVLISVSNTGANDEKVQLKIASSIGSASSAVLSLKEGDSTTQYLSFAIPAGAKDGKYSVAVSAVYGGYTSTKSFVLAVAAPKLSEGDTSITIVEPSTEPKEGTQIPATELALGIIILLLAAIIIWFGKDLLPSQAKPVVVKARGR